MKKGNCILLFALYVGATWLFLGSTQSDPTLQRILIELRIPRLLVLLSVGGLLAAVGASYQVLFNNALAEPYVLGISSAVILAAAVGETFFHFSSFSIMHLLLCITASTLASVCLLGVGSFHKSQSAEKTILFGMGMNFVFSSLLFLVLSYASQQLGGGSLRWLFGQIPWMPLQSALFVVAFSFAAFLSLLYLGPILDALSFGDTVARTLGVSPVFSRNLVIFLTSLFVGVLVSQTGSIGFVGLVVPHMARLLFSPKSSRGLLLGSVSIGALFLVLSDYVSRTIAPPMEFPIGIVTTLLGGPFFLWLLWKR